MTRPLRAALAISSFRNDDAVLRILDEARETGALELFSRVFVVDSVGTGRMPGLLRSRGFSSVAYECSDANLGSAGNLARRLALAAADDTLDVVYAVNHDGRVTRGTVERLLQSAGDRPGFGAMYPLRRMTCDGGRFDITGRWSIPVRLRTTAEVPAAQMLRVYWGSSNPALYSLEPLRQGLQPWADLWMGWEDLGYGWLLDEAGWAQWLVCDAITDDNYELRVVGGAVRVSDKPPWYAYYVARNLLLISSRAQIRGARRAAVAARVGAEFGMTLLFRREKRRRLAYLSEGVFDALRGRTGKWRHP